MKPQKYLQSCSKENILRNRALLHGGKRFDMEDAITNDRFNRSCSSESSGVYIEDEEIGNASTSQESTEYVVSLTSSIDISSASMLRFQKSRVPSWSDSSGSTYVSGELLVSPQHSFKDSVRRKENGWSASNSNNLDIILQSPDAADMNRGRRVKVTRELEGIPYYPAVEEAFSNTELSAIESLQKETAQSIFCQRLVPLLIPEQPRDEDISAVSIAEDPPESVSKTKSKSHGRSIERLENVEYLPSIEVATDNEDISTVAYRMPYKIAHQAFGRSKNAANKSMELPRLIIHSNSHSTVSSLESNSDLESEDESYGDADSNEATRQPKATIGKTKLRKRDDRIWDSDDGLNGKESDVSSSDARIRELKKKIEKLKKGPTLERAMPTQRHEGGILCREERFKPKGPERLPMQRNEQRSSDSDDIDSISEKIHELTRVARDQRRRRGDNFVDDLTGGLAHCRPFEHFEAGPSHGEFMSQEVRISEDNHSLAFGQGEFPIMIHHARQDDVSAMYEQSDACQVSDIETALRSAMERKRRKAAMKSREARERFQRTMVDFFSRGKEFIFRAMTESKKYEPQPSLQKSWAGCMEGRSAGEGILIVSVSIALAVLFILLVVVLAGR